MQLEERDLPRNTKVARCLKLSYTEHVQGVLGVIYPKPMGPWHTIYMRWQRWVIDGVLNRAWGVLKELQPDGGKLDFSMVFLDSTVVRAHQHAAGAQKKRPTSLGAFKGRVLLQNTRRLC